MVQSGFQRWCSWKTFPHCREWLRVSHLVGAIATHRLAIQLFRAFFSLAVMVPLVPRVSFLFDVVGVRMGHLEYEETETRHACEKRTDISDRYDKSVV